jgi:hypothetical protein
MPLTRAFTTGAVRRPILRPIVAATGAAIAVIAGSSAPAVAAPGAGRAATTVQALAPPSLFAWGSAIFGQLGNGVAGGLNNPVEADTPVPITLPASVVRDHPPPLWLSALCRIYPPRGSWERGSSGLRAEPGRR